METEGTLGAGEKYAGDPGDPCAMVIFDASLRARVRRHQRFLAVSNHAVMYDCMLGDATLFQRSHTVEAAWNVVAPIQNVWGALEPREFPNYAAGAWGPEEANELLGRDGRRWYDAPLLRGNVDTKIAGA